MLTVITATEKGIVQLLVFTKRRERISQLEIIDGYLKDHMYLLRYELTKKDPRKNGYLSLDFLLKYRYVYEHQKPISGILTVDALDT